MLAEGNTDIGQKNWLLRILKNSGLHSSHTSAGECISSSEKNKPLLHLSGLGYIPPEPLYKDHVMRCILYASFIGIQTLFPILSLNKS